MHLLSDCALWSNKKKKKLSVKGFNSLPSVKEAWYQIPFQSIKQSVLKYDLDQSDSHISPYMFK